MKSNRHFNFKSLFFGKRDISLAVGLLCISGFISCKNYLEEKPLTSYSASQFYDSPKKLNSAVLGIYDALASRELFGTNIVLLGGDTDTEILRNTTVTGALGTIEEVGHYNTKDKSTPVETMWGEFYGALNNANNVIKNGSVVPTASENEEKEVKKYIAEAKALRAFIYTNIVIRWGDVPLRTEPSDLSQDLILARTPKADIYEQIIKDFEEAIPDLPWHDDKDADVGRMNKGAAMALYTRALLFAGGYSLYQDGTIKRPVNYLNYYEKAKVVTEQLISSGKHSLNPSFENVFKNICGNVLEPRESMFEIDMAYLYGQSRHAGSIGVTSSGVVVTNHSALYNARPKIFTHYYLYNKFDPKDTRRGVSVATYTLDGPKFTEKPIPVTLSSTWSCAKWRRSWHTSVPINFSLSDVNFVVIRYAEVLLMRAEILNELNGGPTQEAIALVNEVRKRGFGPNVSGDNANVPIEFTTSKNTFIDFISDEYAREFYGESNRKFDLIRWNLLGKRIGEMAKIFDDPATKALHGLKVYLAGQLFKSGKHELFPIPYREIVESNGKLTQNPGY